VDGGRDAPLPRPQPHTSGASSAAASSATPPPHVPKAVHGRGRCPALRGRGLVGPVRLTGRERPRRLQALDLRPQRLQGRRVAAEAVQPLDNRRQGVLDGGELAVL